MAGKFAIYWWHYSCFSDQYKNCSTSKSFTMHNQSNIDCIADRNSILAVAIISKTMAMRKKVWRKTGMKKELECDCGFLCW